MIYRDLRWNYLCNLIKRCFCVQSIDNEHVYEKLYQDDNEDQDKYQDKYSQTNFSNNNNNNFIFKEHIDFPLSFSSQYSNTNNDDYRFLKHDNVD